MEKLFKTEQTNDLFYRWISIHPESHHPLDINRFNYFVLSLLENNQILTEELLRSAIKSEKQWQNQEAIENFINQYLDKYHTIRDFWNNYKKNN
jgi:hypothetical protein